jgi:hypothetical protein
LKYFFTGPKRWKCHPQAQELTFPEKLLELCRDVGCMVTYTVIEKNLFLSEEGRVFYLDSSLQVQQTFAVAVCIHC